MELLSLDPKNVSEIGEAIKDLKKAKKVLDIYVQCIFSFFVTYF